MSDTLSAPELEWSLLGTKYSHDELTLYANHAHARGGVGVLMSTGVARGPISRLPVVTHAARSMTQSARPSTMGSTTHSTALRALSAGRTRPAGITTLTATAKGMSLQSYGSGANSGFGGSEDFGDLSMSLPTGSSLGASGLAGTLTPNIAKPEWQKGVAHPNNFVSATRRARMYDVAKANKWSAMSYFEVDPGEIKRHLDIVHMMDQVHAQSKYQELDNDRLRHQTWAARQKEIFRRQRQESAARYRRSGLAIPETYTISSAPASPREQGTGVAEGSTLGSTMRGSSTSLTGGALLPTTSSNRPGTVSTIASGYSASGLSSSFGGGGSTFGTAGGGGGGIAGGVPAVPSISLPKPTFFKIYDRMLNESEEGPQGKTIALNRKVGEEARAREDAEVKEQMRGLDGFEAHMRSIARGRAQ